MNMVLYNERIGAHMTYQPNSPPKFDRSFDYRSESEPPVDVPLNALKASASGHSHILGDERSATPFGINRGPLRGLTFTRDIHPWQIMQHLANNLPLNDYKLPSMIYRPDMIDFQQLRLLFSGLQSTATTTTVSFPSDQGGIGNVRQQIMMSLSDILSAAEVQLDYSEGYPMLPNGMALWQQFDWEAPETYNMFVSYLELEGVRMVSDLKSYPLDIARANLHMHYWLIRVKAYELYKVAASHKKRMQRLLSVDDNHFAIAEKAMKKLQGYLETATFDDTTLSPDKAVAMFEKLSKIQRVAAGLNANGEKDGTEPGKVAPVQVTMQQIVQRSEGTTKVEEDHPIDILNERPDLLDAAQDLILQAHDVTDSFSDKK